MGQAQRPAVGSPRTGRAPPWPYKKADRLYFRGKTQNEEKQGRARRGERRATELKGERILIDLAVPRDIEPSVGELPGVRLYDIDSFHLESQPETMRRQIQAAERIAEEMEGEFLSWAACRDLIPKVQRISHLAARDAVWRTGKAVKELGLSKTEQANLEQTMENATTKVIGKLMFELRDSLNTDTFRECLEVLEQVYPVP